MNKKPPYLRLVPGPAPKPGKSLQIAANTAEQAELSQIGDKLRTPTQLVMQMPADFDCRQYIQLAPSNLGLDSASQFEHPDDATPYLRLTKNLDPQETAESRFKSLAAVIAQIREGLKDFYGEKALILSAQDSFWNLRLPFGIKDNRTFEHTQTITNAIRESGLKINNPTTHFEITDQQMILCVKDKKPANLIRQTRENLQYFPFLLEDLKEVLI